MQEQKIKLYQVGTFAVGNRLLDPEQRTFGHLLQDAGYRTAVVGKWQLLGAEQYSEQFRGKVWLGNGWRSEKQQRDLFLSRHQEDPNGAISWGGKKWKRVRGAPAAPPGWRAPGAHDRAGSPESLP